MHGLRRRLLDSHFSDFLRIRAVPSSPFYFIHPFLNLLLVESKGSTTPNKVEENHSRAWRLWNANKLIFIFIYLFMASTVVTKNQFGTYWFYWCFDGAGMNLVIHTYVPKTLSQRDSREPKLHEGRVWWRSWSWTDNLMYWKKGSAKKYFMV